MQMTDTQEELMELSSELGMTKPKMSVLTFCPFCNEMTLMLHEHRYRYECENLMCGAEGSIQELKYKYFNDMISKPRGVNLN